MATLSKEVEQLLTNAGFVHLGTCHNNQPNVTLMNYTYIADEQAIVLTTRKSSTTYVNLSQNPLVSVLVHDWVTARSRVVGPGAVAAGAASEHQPERDQLHECDSQWLRTSGGGPGRGPKVPC